MENEILRNAAAYFARDALPIFSEADYSQAIADAGLAHERIDRPMPGRDRYVCWHA